MNKQPCLNCTDRKLGCHGACERYQEFQKKNEEAKAKERAESLAYENYRNYREEKVKRLKGGRS